MRRFRIESRVAGNATLISQKHLTMEGVNFELMPLIRMTAPANLYTCHLKELSANTKSFNSLVLLLGFIPVDIHSFAFLELDEQGFSEQSSSLLNSLWQHERLIKACDDECIIIDEISFVTRIKLLSPLLLPIYKAIFKHRHKRLRKKWNEADLYK